MVRFDTLKAEEIKFGTRNFLEIARKKAIAEGPEGVTESEFVAVSRGFYSPTGEKRFRSSIAIPPDQVKAVVAALQTVTG